MKLTTVTNELGKEVFTYTTLPDPGSHMYDYTLYKKYPNHDHYGSVICNMKAGNYHIWLKSSRNHVVSGLQINYIPLILVKRESV